MNNNQEIQNALLSEDTERKGNKQGRLNLFRGCITNVVWIGLIVFFVQNAWASVYENETRAGMIYAGFALLLLFGGIIVNISKKLDL